MESLAPAIEPHTEKILLIPALGTRWGCTAKTALHRAEQAGLQILRVNERVHGVRLSAILKLEQDWEGSAK